MHSFKKYVYHMLVKLEQNHMVPTIPNFDLFEKEKKRKQNTIV